MQWCISSVMVGASGSPGFLWWLCAATSSAMEPYSLCATVRRLPTGKARGPSPLRTICAMAFPLVMSPALLACATAIMASALAISFMVDSRGKFVFSLGMFIPPFRCRYR